MTSKVRIIDPVLGFGRESKLQFYHLHASATDSQTFRSYPLHTMNLVNINMINMTWISWRYVLIIDDREQLHIYEVGGSLISTLSFAHCGLVYASGDFKVLLSIV